MKFDSGFGQGSRKIEELKKKFERTSGEDETIHCEDEIEIHYETGIC